MEAHFTPLTAHVKTHMFSIPSLGRAEQIITPRQRGRVRFQATSWPARFYDRSCQATVLPNEAVTVVGRQGITLLVIPVRRDNSLIISPSPQVSA